MNCQLNRFNDPAFVYLSIQGTVLITLTPLTVSDWYFYLVKIQSCHGVWSVDDPGLTS